MSRPAARGAAVLLFLTGCGGSCPEAATASSAPVAEAPAPTGSEGDDGKIEKPDTEVKAETKANATDQSSTPPAAVTPEPSFPDDASVAQAMAAVPAGTQRSNIDAETLGAPLQSETLYEPCKVGTQHFKLRVAVWNGHAVGVDVTTPNKALASCIDKRVRGVEWRDKVRSHNTVDYSM